MRRPLATPCSLSDLAQAVAHREAAKAQAYFAPRQAAASRRYMRHYALRARGIFGDGSLPTRIIYRAGTQGHGKTLLAQFGLVALFSKSS